jgi:hypothetical protein
MQSDKHKKSSNIRTKPIIESHAKPSKSPTVAATLPGVTSKKPFPKAVNTESVEALLNEDDESPMSASVPVEVQTARRNSNTELEGKYVGLEARSLFFDRMKFMSHHNQISRHKPDQNVTALHFEHDDKINDEHLEQISNSMKDKFTIDASRVQTSTNRYVGMQHSSLTSETPRGLASLIMNTALPPIVISGPSKDKSNPSSTIHRSKSPYDALKPKSCPPSALAAESLHSKFDFNSPKANASSRKGSLKKQYIHHLASLALEEEDDEVVADNFRSITTDFSRADSMSPSGEESYFSSAAQTPSSRPLMSKYNSKLDYLSQSGSTSNSPASSARPLSPRSKFISKCLEKKMNPRASLILRKGIDQTEMNLQHMSLGNDMTCVLAECLVDLPYDIESINLTNNGLDGKSIAPLLRSLKSCATIRSLNLSYNNMDKASIDALAEYFLQKSSSTESTGDDTINTSKSLKKLILQHTEIDDNDAEKLLKALASNVTLTEVDLSNNKIGSNENRRSIQSNYVTFTEALAETIKKPYCSLEKLNLSWNTIRLQGALALTKAIALNKSLTFLDLSYNSLVSYIMSASSHELILINVEL